MQLKSKPRTNSALVVVLAAIAPVLAAACPQRQNALLTAFETGIHGTIDDALDYLFDGDRAEMSH